MNFFSHYHFDHKPGNHWYNAGLLFPDLLRNFTIKQRITSWSQALKTKDHHDLKQGIKRHIEADGKFHNWDVFEQKNLMLSHKMRDSGLEIERDWFLGHIMVELAIDHILVKKHESELHQLYIDLKACEQDEWKSYFAQGNLTQFDLWMNGLSKFIEHAYLFSYKNTENVIYALGRIYQKMGLKKFNEEQNQFLVVLLNDFIPELEFEIPKLSQLLK